ncbi:hypothetical protein [Burkholderia cenocepacia]|uniref:hypothetical protein n=1 Tax=Burkholderia cenocepacia TaxID=95486 RepID=UPI001589BA7D|nr:hypothetical protein [Burkholderia cenocepacia]
MFKPGFLIFMALQKLRQVITRSRDLVREQVNSGSDLALDLGEHDVKYQEVRRGIDAAADILHIIVATAAREPAVSAFSLDCESEEFAAPSTGAAEETFPVSPEDESDCISLHQRRRDQNTPWLCPNARKQKARFIEPGFLLEFVGVADGTRTHDDRNHNSYTLIIYFNGL